MDKKNSVEEDKIKVSKVVMKDSIDLFIATAKNLNRICDDVHFYADKFEDVSKEEIREYFGEDLSNEFINASEELSNAIDKVNNLFL